MTDDRFSNLWFSDGDIVYIRPCWSLVLFFEGSLVEHAEGVLDFYREGINWIGEHLNYRQTGTMRKPRRLKAKTNAEKQALLFINEKSPHIFKLFLESESSATAAPGYGLVVYYNGIEDVGALRLFLPAEETAGNEAMYAERAQRAAATLRLSSGFAGFGLSRAEEADISCEYLPNFYFVSRRYRGVDVGELLQAMYAIPNGIRCVNWLTFVGQRWLEPLGGIAGLTHQFPAEVSVRELSHGVVIQAGAQPVLGDVNRPDDTELYRVVGRRLAPIRSQTHPHFLFRSEFQRDNEEWSEEWLARFDD